MHEVLVNRLGGLSLPRKSVVRLTDRPDMTLDVYRGRKTTKQQTTTTSGGRLRLAHAIKHVLHHKFRHFVKENTKKIEQIFCLGGKR